MTRYGYVLAALCAAIFTLVFTAGVAFAVTITLDDFGGIIVKLPDERWPVAERSPGDGGVVVFAADEQKISSIVVVATTTGQEGRFDSIDDWLLGSELENFLKWYADGVYKKPGKYRERLREEGTVTLASGQVVKVLELALTINGNDRNIKVGYFPDPTNSWWYWFALYNQGRAASHGETFNQVVSGISWPG